MEINGVFRKVDDLGRIVIPKDYRKPLNIREGDDLQIFALSDGILLKKSALTYSPECIEENDSCGTEIADSLRDEKKLYILQDLYGSNFFYLRLTANEKAVLEWSLEQEFCNGQCELKEFDKEEIKEF